MRLEQLEARPRLRLLTSLLLLPVILAFSVFGQKYDLSLHRPGKTGEVERADIRVTIEEYRTNRSSELTITNFESRTVKLSGTTTADEFDSNGFLTKFHFAVSNFLESIGGTNYVILPSGQELAVALSATEVSFQLKEGAPILSIQERLAMCFNKGSYAIFLAATNPQEVGGRWEIDRSRIAHLGEIPPGFVIDKDATAHARLVAVTNLQQRGFLVVTTDATGSCAPNMAVDLDYRKRGLKFEEARFSVAIEGFYPTNVSRPSPTMEKSDFTLFAIFSVRDGSIHRRLRIKRDLRFEPVPRGSNGD